MQRLGTGIGWRPEIADAVERMRGIDWVEAVAENVCPGHLPESLRRLRARGVTVIPHGVSLGLGGADRPEESLPRHSPSGPRRWARRWSPSTSRSYGRVGR